MNRLSMWVLQEFLEKLINRICTPSFSFFSDASGVITSSKTCANTTCHHVHSHNAPFTLLPLVIGDSCESLSDCFELFSHPTVRLALLCTHTHTHTSTRTSANQVLLFYGPYPPCVLQELDESSKFTCSKCNTATKAMSADTVTVWPRLLCIQLKRFAYLASPGLSLAPKLKPGATMKNERFISFPALLDIVRNCVLNALFRCTGSSIMFCFAEQP